MPTRSWCLSRRSGSRFWTAWVRRRMPATQQGCSIQSSPPGLQWYWKADFFMKPCDAAIGDHVERGSEIPTRRRPPCTCTRSTARRTVTVRTTLPGYRDATWGQVMVGVDPDPANKEKIVTWARDYFDALHPLSARRRLRQLHDGGRRRSHPHHLSRNKRRAWRRSRGATIRITSCSG